MCNMFLSMCSLEILLLLVSFPILLDGAFAETKDTSENITTTIQKKHDEYMYKIPLVLNFTRWQNHTQQRGEDLKMMSSESLRRREKIRKKAMKHRTIKMMTELQVGTPPQKIWFVVDTASELTWLQCSSKNSINHAKGFIAKHKFHPHVSSTFQEVSCNSNTCSSLSSDLPIPNSCNTHKKCAFTCSYADATSVEGELGNDLFRVSYTQSFKLAFGCSHSSLRATPALLGLNRGKLSLISQLHSVAKIPWRFSLCFSSSSPLGTLYLGGSPHHIRRSLRYTPLVTMSSSLPYFDRSAYTVRVESIKVGNVKLPIRKSVFMPDHTGAGQTMFDSASHFTLLLGEAYTALRQEFIKQNKGLLGMPMSNNFVYEGALDLCYDRASVSVKNLSPVTLILQSTELVIPGKNLIFKVPTMKNVYCFSFGNADLVAVEENIIGNFHQRDLWIEYDLENARIGFAGAPC